MATIASAKEAKTHRWPPQGEWTYEDYARLPDSGVRYEVIGGDLYMSPAPSMEHQNVIFELIVTTKPTPFVVTISIITERLKSLLPGPPPL